MNPDTARAGSDPLPSGIPRVGDYERARASEAFGEMTAFAARFVEQHAEALRWYSSRWSADPLAHFGRRWEYPFVLSWLPDGPGAVIVDAGSGATFFPAFVAERLRPAELICIDHDPRVGEALERIAVTPVRFQREDLAAMSLADASVDVVVCVSVLEHLRDPARAVAEFARVLRPGGRLVLTFDVSLDGRSEIPVEQAAALLETVTSVLRPLADAPPVEEEARDPGILRSARLRRTDPGSLPWRYPTLSAIKRAARLRRLPKRFPDVTVYGLAAER